MLSRIDLRDFLEINQGLYGESVSPAHIALFRALAEALEPGTMNSRTAALGVTGREHDASR
jgi:hypothetical protein